MHYDIISVILALNLVNLVVIMMMMMMMMIPLANKNIL